MGGVALLDLGAAVLQALVVVGLGRAGGAADAVAAGAAAQQDDHVAGGGALPPDMAGGGGAHHRADLHPLGHIAGVVDLIHLAGGQADLVAVGGIARRRGGDQLALGQLAGQGLADRDQGVPRAGDPHGLIDVAAAGQGVADGAADAGGRAAEGLDLGGVVVGLVFEQEQPVLVLAVHVALDLDGAGVDLVALVQVGQDAALLEGPGAHGGHIHQAAGLFGAAGLLPQGHVAVKGLLHHGVVDLHVVQDGAEGGVAAVVGPVGVDHPDLGDGGVPLLGAEVVLAELDVAVVHGQALFGDESLQPRLVQLVEAGEGGHRPGHGVGHLEGGAGLEGSLPCLHRVDDILFDLLHLGVGQRALQQVDLGRTDQRPLALADELDALGGRVGPLVELAGQVLHRKGQALVGRQFAAGVVHRRLAEHGAGALAEQLFRDSLHVVAVQQAEAGQAADAQQGGQLVLQLAGLAVEARLLFHIDSVYHRLISLLFQRRPLPQALPWHPPFRQRLPASLPARARRRGGTDQELLVAKILLIVCRRRVICRLPAPSGRARRCRCGGAACRSGSCPPRHTPFPGRRAGCPRWR